MQVVDIIAKSLVEADIDNLTGEQIAHVVIEVLDRAGFAIVPRELTIKMIADALKRAAMRGLG
jgi:hypothetical protein